ncbi:MULTISPECIES: sensor histidine kinase [unclassified Microbacterium]|uniref:sensor histidine kinase n=1 Tax=unclassified Microbacterium TaxID=2609290 RepID=UPI00214BB253|nr:MULTISPECIES: sensor histidine kinase [unclassified Microbacterium]MCR2808865.1 HAMP domain-containing histidine kinase [Microbacterium sp. zg.B185]WIM18716.1 HAMP domain-containing sensor histidine kinase [Microbacterium sp. zg-B185]
MTTGGRRRALPMGAPDVRTRSIWMTQLVLAASVVVIGLLVLAVQPQLFAVWTFTAGLTAIILFTLATLIVPWSRLPKVAVLTVPFLDALAIGFIGITTEQAFSFLWVFPVMWVSMNFRAETIGAMLGVIGAILLIDATAPWGTGPTLTIFIVMLSLTFIGITTHLAIRRTRSLRRLLIRQAGRLNATADRRKDQERSAREILNGVDTGIARISKAGAVLAVNDSYTRLYALDPLDPSLPARSVEYTGLREMPIPAMDRPFARAARGETFSDVRVWLFTPKGEWHALSVSTKRVQASAREEPSHLLVVNDITDITHAERERARLAAIASHELKHPLTVLIGNAELALESDDLTPKTRQRIETMLGASNRMVEMTASMLTSSRTTGNYTHDEIDLSEIVADSVASFSPTARAHNVTIDTPVANPLLIVGDAFRLRQVIDNLLSNAIKYTPSGGRIQIRTRRDGTTAEFVVADTGIGVSAEELPKLFDPYYRAPAAKETATGTGLGLGITHEIVTSHNGTLSIESETGVGTTVTVRLPTSAAIASRAGAGETA